ncbi:MAG: hypothetical protein ACRERY_15915 [Pseudomonas sp.]
MLRIRGHIGDWPVDLTLELAAEDWARLAAQLPAQGAAAEPLGAAAHAGDALWQSAQEVLRKAGRMEGPELLAELQALAGSAAAGKRLLVRLRHSAQVKLASGADAPLYSWVGKQQP